jgi:hypothetical protein
MKIINKEIKHVLFGEGEVVSQEAQRISVRFSEQYGIKQFVYPDALGKYLKLYDTDLEMVVMEELHCKQEQIKDEKERRQNQYDESIATEKLKLKVEKKKISRKSKI